MHQHFAKALHIVTIVTINKPQEGVSWFPEEEKWLDMMLTDSQLWHQTLLMLAQPEN